MSNTLSSLFMKALIEFFRRLRSTVFLFGHRRLHRSCVSNSITSHLGTSDVPPSQPLKRGQHGQLPQLTGRPLQTEEPIGD
jgi:hypothetical protein